MTKMTIDLPRAFSIRDDHELYPIQHLMARLNPALLVSQVGTGRHINGGGTVFWGVVYGQGQRVTLEELETALREAGCDLGHSVIQLAKLPCLAQSASKA